MGAEREAWSLAQIEFDVAVVAYQKARETLARKGAALPELLTTDTASGGLDIVEYGYSRTELLDCEPGEDMHAISHGWDAYSESGAGQHVIYDGAPYRLPETVVWD